MGIQDYSITPANNTALFPEGMARATVNDSARQLQADTRTWYETAEWVDYGYTPTYVSTTSFSMSGDKTTFYTVNRRIRITDSSTLYGVITASSFSAGNTTVTVTLDSGSISASITATALHIIKLASQGLFLTGMTLAGTTALTNITVSGTATFADIKVINSINDTNNNEVIKVGTVASAVNEITITNAATGSGATIAATGGDANINLNLVSKGTGQVLINGSPIAPTGSVMYFAANSAPTGWLECSGAAISRTTYAALFAVIGTTFGAGDGSTTFNLPQTRGEFVRGWDNGRGVDSGRVFGSNQTDAIQNITGQLGTQRSILSATGAFSLGTGSGGVGSGASATTSYTLDFNASNVVRTSTETRPQNIALMTIIKF